MSGDTHMFSVLLKLAVDIDHARIAQMLILKANAVQRDAMLLRAVSNRQADMVRVLLIHRADPRAYGDLPLRIAVEENLREIEDLLRRFGGGGGSDSD